MRMIMGDKIYDTEKSETIATLVVEVISRKVVYKTESGRYYSILYMPFGNCRATSLTKEGVKKMLVENNLVDEYVKEFGELEYV